MFDIYIRNYLDDEGVVQSKWKKLYSIPIDNKINMLENPIVKCEMGKSGSFDFGMNPGHPYYWKTIQMKTMFDVVYDGDSIFCGRVLTVTKDLYDVKQVHCEGALSLLLDSYMSPSKEKNRTETNMGTYIQSLITNHNSQVDSWKHFTVGNVPSNYSNDIKADQKITEKTKKYGTDNWATTMSCLEELLKQHGGFLRVRFVRDYDGDTDDGEFYLDWLQNYFRDWDPQTMRSITISDNMMDRSINYDTSDLFTVLIPYSTKGSSDFHLTADCWPSAYQSEHSGNVQMKVSELVTCGLYSDSELRTPYVGPSFYSSANETYGTIVKAQKFENAKTRQELFSFAKEYIKDYYHGITAKATVKAFDLHLTGNEPEKYQLGDVTKVQHYNKNVIENPGYITLCIMSIQYDLYNPENNSYSICVPWSSLSKTYGTPTKGGGGGQKQSDPEKKLTPEEEAQERAKNILNEYHGQWLVQSAAGLYTGDFPQFILDNVLTQYENNELRAFQAADVIVKEQNFTKEEIFTLQSDFMKVIGADFKSAVIENKMRIAGNVFVVDNAGATVNGVLEYNNETVSKQNLCYVDADTGQTVRLEVYVPLGGGGSGSSGSSPILPAPGGGT